MDHLFLDISCLFTASEFHVGDGRVLAADGAAYISVINNTALDMNVGKVLNNQREGIITIADTAKDTWTEYKKGQTRVIRYDENEPGSMGYAAYLEKYVGLAGLACPLSLFPIRGIQCNFALDLSLQISPGLLRGLNYLSASRWYCPTIFRHPLLYDKGF